MVEEIKYSDILLEKQRQCQDFRRYITFKSSGKFVKHRLGCDINFIKWSVKPIGHEVPMGCKRLL